MNSLSPGHDVLRWLLRVPLASSRELASLMQTAESTVYRLVQAEEGQGFVTHVSAGCPGVPPARRYWLTPAGIRELGLSDRTPADQLLNSFPISREWLHALLRRLDSLIPIYQLAAASADEFEIIDFRWYRTIPLDAAFCFDDNEWVAIHREGPLATLFHRRRRLKTLVDEGFVLSTLVLVADSVRQRDWFRRMHRAGMPGAIAVEGRFLANRDPQSRIWLATSTARFETLETVLAELGSSSAPIERVFARATPPPISLTPKSENGAVPKDYELPLLLNPSEKEALNLVAAWPLLTIANAADFTGITRQGVEKALRTPARLGLLDSFIPGGRRTTSLALSNRGLLMLARHDRLPTRDILNHWSVATADTNAYFDASDLRGVRMRPLLRAKSHTKMVTDFFASFHRYAREAGSVLREVESFHRSWRGFTDRERGRGQLRPDGYAVFESEGVRVPFFLEWERRADRWSRYVGKLRPYIKYYGSGRAFEDAGEWPFVLMVLRDGKREDEFWEVATRELRSDGVAGRLRILTATEELVLLRGPHRGIWRVTPNPKRLTLPDAAIQRRVIAHEKNFQRKHL